jgi:hypothetical protein
LGVVGERKMSSEREQLVIRARQLDLFPEPEKRTDQQLRDAIAAEEAAGAWLARLEQLPTDEAKRDAVHRLRLDLDEAVSRIPRVSCQECGRPTREDLNPCTGCFYKAKSAAVPVPEEQP